MQMLAPKPLADESDEGRLSKREIKYLHIAAVTTLREYLKRIEDVGGLKTAKLRAKIRALIDGHDRLTAEMVQLHPQDIGVSLEYADPGRVVKTFPEGFTIVKIDPNTWGSEYRVDCLDGRMSRDAGSYGDAVQTVLDIIDGGEYIRW